MNKKIAALLVFVMFFSLVSIGSGDSGDNPTLNIGWVYDENLENERSLGYIRKGLADLVKKYENDYEIIITEYHPIEPGFTLAMAFDDAVLIEEIVLTVGWQYDGFVFDIADFNTNTTFVIIDSYPAEYDGDEWITRDNVVGYGFVHEEMGFLAGLAAGETTKNDSIGFIGGTDVDFINVFKSGYEEGMKEINKKALLHNEYADSFGDIYAGFYHATFLNQSEGADVIFHAAGDVGLGVFESAELFGYWAIGIEFDQGEAAPNNVLCSVVKYVDRAIVKSIDDYIGDVELDVDNFYKLGVVDGGVDYVDNQGNLSPKLVRLLELYKDMIKDGTYVVQEFIPESE